MTMHRVPTKPRAWIPRNHSRTQKKMITTGSTIFSPKYIWVNPMLRRHLLSSPNRVPRRSQSSTWEALVVGSSTWGHLAKGSLVWRGLAGRSVGGRAIALGLSWIRLAVWLDAWWGLHFLPLSSSSKSRRSRTRWSFTVDGVNVDMLLIPSE